MGTRGRGYVSSRLVDHRHDEVRDPGLPPRPGLADLVCAAPYVTFALEDSPPGLRVLHTMLSERGGPAHRPSVRGPVAEGPADTRRRATGDRPKG